MCGICGIAAAAGRRRPATARGDERHARPSRTRLPTARSSTGRVGARRRGGSRSSTSRRATSRSRTRTAPSHVVQNGEIYNYRELRASSSAQGHRFRTHGDTEVHRRTSTRSTATRSPSGCAGCSRSRSGTRARRRLVLARDRFGIKPLYYRAGGGRARVRVRAARAAARRDRPRRARGVPRVQLDPGAADDLPRDAQAACRAPARLGDGRSRSSSASRGPAPVRRRASSGDEDGRARRGAARAAARLGARAPRQRRAGRRASSPAASTPSLLAALAARGDAPSRCARSRSASRSARSTSSPTRGASPSATGRDHRELVLRPDAARAPARARRGVRRAVRRLVGAADLPRLASSPPSDVKVALSGEGGDELFGGYYTYAADLLRRALGAARAARAAARRAAADLDAPRRASTTARSASCARRTCRRSSATTAGRRSSPPDARAELTGRRHGVRPGRPAPRALRRDARAPSCSRACRTSTCGVYLVDDLLVKTDRASMAHSLEARVPFLDPVVADFALALPTRHKVRGLAQEGAAAQGGRAAAAARDRARPQARLLDPGGGLAARRARAVRARRRSRAETLRRQGFFEPAAVRRASSTTTSPAARTCSRQLWGLLALHALARARTSSGRRARCATERVAEAVGA